MAPINTRLKTIYILSQREHSAQRVAVRRKKLLTQTSLYHLGMVTEKLRNLLEKRVEVPRQLRVIRCRRQRLGTIKQRKNSSGFSFLRTIIAICQKSRKAKFWEVIDIVALSRTLLRRRFALLVHRNKNLMNYGSRPNNSKPLRADKIFTMRDI